MLQVGQCKSRRRAAVVGGPPSRRSSRRTDFRRHVHRELKPRLGRRRRCASSTSSPSTRLATERGARRPEDAFTQAMSALRRVARPGSLVVISAISSGSRVRPVVPVECRAPQRGAGRVPQRSARARTAAARPLPARAMTTNSPSTPTRSRRAVTTARLRGSAARARTLLPDLRRAPDAVVDRRRPVSTLQTALGRRTH